MIEIKKKRSLKINNVIVEKNWKNYWFFFSQYFEVKKLINELIQKVNEVKWFSNIFLGFYRLKYSNILFF